MSTTSGGKKLPSRFELEMQANYLRIKSAVSAQQLWDDVLTEEERRRLGGDPESAYRGLGTAGMWMKLRGVGVERAVVDVAHELGFVDNHTRRWLLRELGELPDDPEAAIQAAVAATDLVLVARRQEAYWQGTLVDADWSRSQVLWDYFWELSAKAKSGMPLDRLDFKRGKDVDLLAKRKNRLRSLRGFPQDLTELIKQVGLGTQRLDLSPQRIRLFDAQSTETLREITG